MLSPRFSLMLFLAVVIRSAFLVCGSIAETTFQYATNDKLHSQLPFGSASVVEDISKRKLESLQKYQTENRTPLYESQIQKQSNSLNGDVRFTSLEAAGKKFRRHSRKKRNIARDSNGWFFNLNVTRPGGSVPLSSEDKADPRFGISIHVEGEEDSSDVQVAWDHVQTLVQNLFGGNYEELSKRGHEVIIDLSGLPNNAQTELKAKEHLVEIQPPKGKEAKVFLGFLGLGGNREKPTTEKVRDVVSQVSSSFAPSPVLSETISITESPTEIPLLEVNPVITDSTISGPVTPESTVQPLVEHLENVRSTTPQSNFSMVVPHVEYVETVPIKIPDSKEELSTSISEKNQNSDLLDELEWTLTTETTKETPGVPLENVNLGEVLIDLEENVKDQSSSLGTSISTESFFSVGVSVSPEQLREFCVNLLEKIQKSSRSGQKLIVEGSENSTADENKGVTVKSAEANIITDTSSRPKPENSGFFASILTRIVGRKAAPDATSASKLPKTDDQRSSFFKNMVWNSGRGRSLEGDITNSNLLEDDINGTEFEDHNVTVSDCEMFFQDWLNMDQDDTTSNPLNVTSLKIEDVTPVEVISEPNEIENQSENSFDEDAKRSILENVDGNGSSAITERSLSETTTFKAEVKNLEVIEAAIDRGTTSDPEEKEARIFGIFGSLDVGSGAREISVDVNEDFADNISTPISGFERGLHGLDTKEKNSATSNDALEVTTENGRRFMGFLNLGSGERQLGEESEFTNDYLLTGELKTGMGTQRFDKMPSTETPKDQITTEDDGLHRSFLGFLNIGSGDGRGLSETDDSGLDIILPECLTCSVDNRTGKVECSECTQEEIALRKSEASTITIGDAEDGQLERKMGGNSEYDPNERFFLSGNRESTEEIVMKDHDDGDSTSTTVLPILEPRGSRALDDQISEWDDNESDEMFDPNVKGEFVSTAEARPVHKHSPLKGRRGRSEDVPLEDNNEPFQAKVVTSPNFVVGIDPISVEIFRNVRSSSKPELAKSTFNESFGEFSVTEAGEDVITTTGGQRLTRSNRCNDDGDCHSDLNEVCLAQERQSVCECEDGFIRFPTTRICSRRVVLEMTFKFPREFYHPNLNDTSSVMFDRKKKDFTESVKALLKDFKLLSDALVDIEVKSFEPGSLIVHANLVFAKPMEMTSLNIVVGVMELFKNDVDPNSSEVAPFNIEKSQILKIFVVGDVCDHQGSSKCHKNAKCIPEKNGGFTCKCKHGYVDLNLNGIPGRECEDTPSLRREYVVIGILRPNTPGDQSSLRNELACPDEFCNKNGICKISHEGIKYCQCSGWNIGTRCEIPGTVVIGGVAAFNFLFLVLIICIICLCRRRKSHSSGQYSGGEEGFSGTPSSAVPSRLRQTVAMKELGQPVVASKYASRSTPCQHKCPDIRIISPSNVGSDQSSVFDSTFDRSTCEQEDAESKV